MKRDNIYRLINSFAVVVAVAMVGVGCQKQSAEETFSDENPINFSVDVATTKAALTQYDESSTDGTNNFTSFSVYGSEVSKDAPTTAISEIFNGKQVALGEDGVWSYDDLQYLSIASAMSVMAVAPYDLTDCGLGVTPSANSIEIEYTVPSDATAQPDLMLATVAPTGEVDNISLNFDHQLAAIRFSLKGGGASFDVVSVKVAGVSASGTLTATADDAGTREWSDLATVSDADDKFEAGLIDSPTSLTDGSTIQITDDDGYLMMIPQTLSLYSQIEVTISYLDNQLATKYIPLDGTEWQAGKIYDYTINVYDVGSDFDFTLSVLDWGEEGDTYTHNSDDETAGMNASIWINLDDYTSYDDLQEAVAVRLEAGITDLVVTGDYITSAEDLLGDGTSSNPSPLATQGVTSIDMSLATGLTSIPAYAFYYCNTLKSIELPKTVTTIDNYAFARCTVLESINLSSITSIGNYAFSSCKALKSLNLPSVTSVGSSTFDSCTTLTSVDMPLLAEISGSNTFYYCTKLASVYMPLLTKISGNRTFNYCYALASVDMPSLTEISGYYTFEYCSALASVDMPSLTEISGYYTFEYCSILASVDMPSLTEISGDYTFNDRSVLASVNMPSLTEISGDNTFESCSILASVNMPSLTEISGDYTFESCSALASVDMPSLEMMSGDYTFASCSDLTSVNMPVLNTISGTYTFRFCTQLTKISLLSLVCISGQSTFYRCESLLNIDLPKVEELVRFTFSNCYALEKIELPKATNLDYAIFNSCSDLESIYLTAQSTINIIYYSGYDADIWSNSNLYLHEDTELDVDFIVKNDLNQQIYYGDNKYTWKSITFVDDDGNEVAYIDENGDKVYY